jgi:hypothetical protein
MRAFKRYGVGVDPGQVRDYTGVAVIEYYDGPPRFSTSVFWPPPTPELRLIWVERLRLGTTHASRARHVAGIVDKLGRDRVDLLVDGTGSGTAFIEAIRMFGFAPVEITITGGREANFHTSVDSMGKREQVSVPNAMFASSLLASLETPPLLRIADGLPFAPVLKQEMLNFSGKRFPNGHESFGARGNGQHDDMTFAVAYLTWWFRRPKPGKIQSGPLRIRGM